MREHDAASIAAFVEFVNQWDEVVACHALTGDMDYLLQVAVRDLEHFSHFLLDRLLNQAGVADVNSSFVLRTVKAFRGLPGVAARFRSPRGLPTKRQPPPSGMLPYFLTSTCSSEPGWSCS